VEGICSMFEEISNTKVYVRILYDEPDRNKTSCILNAKEINTNLRIRKIRLEQLIISLRNPSEEYRKRGEIL